MVFAQALISPAGPSGACVEAALAGRLQLLLSDYVLRELSELPSKLPERLKVSTERTNELTAQLEAFGEHFDTVPSVYVNPFDRDDSPYVDLAVLGKASLITSRDKHLLRLMDQNLPAGRDFRDRFPDLAILTPENLLKLLREELQP
jgi:putative PIN family toxin of toxin-antitoxin system